MVFPGVMYGCESWAIKIAECQRIDAFELWFWRRLLRVPWTARRSNQSVLKEISPEYSLEELMLKLRRQYFGHLMWRTDSLEEMWRTDSLEETLMLGKTEGRRKRRWQRMRWLEGINDLLDMGLRISRHAALHGVTNSRTWLSDWTQSRNPHYDFIDHLVSECVHFYQILYCLGELSLWILWTIKIVESQWVSESSVEKWHESIDQFLKWLYLYMFRSSMP